MYMITPVHKSGDRTLVINYRPISLLCVISKVLERIVYNHLLPFVPDLLSPAQFGFRKKSFVSVANVSISNSIYDSISNDSSMDVIYLDFRKAFDRVAHNELLFKLWSFGITGKTWN